MKYLKLIEDSHDLPDTYGDVKDYLETWASEYPELFGYIDKSYTEGWKHSSVMNGDIERTTTEGGIFSRPHRYMHDNDVFCIKVEYKFLNVINQFDMVRIKRMQSIWKAIEVLFIRLEYFDCSSFMRYNTYLANKPRSFEILVTFNYNKELV